MNALLKYHLLKQQGLDDDAAAEAAGMVDVPDSVTPDEPTPPDDENDMPADEKRTPAQPAVTAAAPPPASPDAQKPASDEVLNWLKGRQADPLADTHNRVELAIIRSRSQPTAADNMVAAEAVRQLGSGKEQAANQQRDDVMNYLYKKQGHEDKAAQLQLERDKVKAAGDARTAAEGKKDERQAELDKRHDVERKENNVYRDQSHQDSMANAEATRNLTAAALGHRIDEDAGKKAAGIPPGFEAVPGSEPSEDGKKKFTALVASQQKMKELTAQMRKELAGVGAMGKLMPGEKKQRLQQLATQIQIEAKNVADLGALSGPDMGLMNQMAADPTSLKSVLSGTANSTLEGLDSWADSSVRAGQRAYGIRARSGGADSRIKVSNGKESYFISPADLADAEKDGFKQVAQ